MDLVILPVDHREQIQPDFGSDHKFQENQTWVSLEFMTQRVSGNIATRASKQHIREL